MKVEDIQALMHSFEQSTLSKMEVKENEFSLKLEKQAVDGIQSEMSSHSIPNIAHDTEAIIESTDVKEEASGTWIKAPLVGTYYAARSQDSKPFIEIGQTVKKGDVLCIIEAMKVMNELHAPCDGIIRSILITNASMVEYDQNLIRIGENV